MNKDIEHTGAIRAVLGRPLVVSVRMLVILLLVTAMCGIVSANITTATNVYEMYLNRVPLISYPDSDQASDSGLPTDRPYYQAGDTVALTISRSIRVEGKLTNFVYLSPTGEPRGVLVNTLESSSPAGYTSRRADVAQIPADTKPGIYCLAGMQTIQTKYGQQSVPWRSAWFYVAERKAE